MNINKLTICGIKLKASKFHISISIGNQFQDNVTWPYGIRLDISYCTWRCGFLQRPITLADKTELIIANPQTH